METFRIGHGYDVHRIVHGEGRMMLCGVQVASDAYFEAHSDGDVAIHALCDALLGAVALGDIGLHFPPSDPQWKGADSSGLLEQVVSMLRSRGYVVGNVDITIALQSPKIGSFVPAMRESLAPLLGVDIDCVSVKATTTERLGFVGRGEGCEVWASGLVRAVNG